LVVERFVSERSSEVDSGLPARYLQAGANEHERVVSVQAWPMNLTLSLLPDSYAICRLNRDAPIPEWAAARAFLSITRTGDELSVVCAEIDVPPGVKSDRGWRCLKVEGPLDLSLTGVLASLANPLAEARIGIFAISTFDTDYVLVKDKNLSRAVEVLVQSGHRLRHAEAGG
jgi:hypothetical protein